MARRKAQVRDIEAWFRFEKGRSCGGKRRFASEREAEDAAYLIRMQGGDELLAYRCRFCRAWHLGHGRAGQPPP